VRLVVRLVPEHDRFDHGGGGLQLEVLRTGIPRAHAVGVFFFRPLRSKALQNKNCRFPVSKSESRNPKSEGKSKILRETKTEQKSRSLAIVSDFELLISFGFRASDFGVHTREMSCGS
jgi:hypothetical protein